MKKKIVIISIILVIIIGIIAAAAIVINGMEKNLDGLMEMEIEDVDLSGLADGTYSGSYKATPIFVKVDVTVKDHVISNIEIIEHDNGKGSAAEAIIIDVVAKNSLDVDAITGATYSSKVILLAIQNTLESARA